MNGFFEGYYFKHQKGPHTVAFIVGVTADHAFIQVITDSVSYNVQYGLEEYRQKGNHIRLGKCSFSTKGIAVDIDRGGINIKGKIRYAYLTPLRYDIMGIFHYLPMECSHSILSLHHDLTGSITIQGQKIDLTGGIGYIEGDRGRSFPRNYLWLQCSDFADKCCIVAACADIPFLGFTFTGCICVVYFQEREYRLATYLGVRILEKTENCLILKQGRYRLEITVDPQGGKPLLAPRMGTMSRGITEYAACPGRFRFYENKQLIFDLKSDHISFEREMRK